MFAGSVHLGSIEDWLLHRSAWQTSRFPLIKVMEHYIDFPNLNDEADRSCIDSDGGMLKSSNHYEEDLSQSAIALYNSRDDAKKWPP